MTFDYAGIVKGYVNTLEGFFFFFKELQCSMSRLTEQNSFVRVNSLSELRGNAVKVWNFPPRTGG